MQVSLSWVKDYTTVDLPVVEMAESLTMAGLEVEHYEDRFARLEKVVSGKVVSVSPHPDADRLCVCEVEASPEQYTVICGAPNVKKGMMAALAVPGAELPSGHTVKKGKIRGVVSEGMLCSEAELSLSDDHSGIMELNPDIAVGLPLTRALSLSDPVFEIDLTPNRPDCLSIMGIAREIAAFSNRKITPPTILLGESAGNVNDYTAVTIEDPDLCPRYAARVVVDISVGSSPFWLRDRLISVGLKPINNIVDITNFVMMETGQPLHAFDLDCLAENRIVVRRAGADTEFTTLDEKERRLSPDMLMICDAEKPVAIAGIMGGLNSEIGDQTKRVLIESACFNPASIRKTAKTLNMSSDAAYRFERGVDPWGTVTAADRAAQLMEEIAGGKAAKGVVDNHPRPAAKKNIRVSPNALNRRLGTSFEAGEIAEFLEAVNFGTKEETKDTLLVTVPSFRVDVERPEDISEEVARLWGYNRIPITFPAISVETGGGETTFLRKHHIKTLMAGFGFKETINYSFISQEDCRAFDLPEDSPRANPISLMNPLTSEQSVMRTSLIPGLLMTVRHNISQQTKDIKLFEIGRVFWPDNGGDLPTEPDMIAALQTGRRNPQSWLTSGEACNFYDLKGMCESLLAALGVKDLTFTALPDEMCTFTRPGHTARVLASDSELGVIGEIADSVSKHFDLPQPVFVCEFNLSTIFSLFTESRQMSPLPRYPSVSRDITVIVEKTVEAGRLLDFLAQNRPNLIEYIQLMDVYEGDRVPAGKKSLSFRIMYRSAEKTLKDNYVNQVHAEVAERLISAFAAELPA